MYRAVVPFLFILLVSCQDRTRQNTEKPIARVMNSALYIKDIEGIFPEGVSREDSIQIAKNYIEKWIRRQLLLNKAELNLDESEKDVKEQIDNYRSSLLIYKYEQSLLKQKLDTVISFQEIQDYYNNNQTNFLLNKNLVKALYIKIKRSSPELWKLRQWYRQDDSESIKNVESYCYKYADFYDYFNDQWIDFSLLIDKIPLQIGNPENYLRYRQYIEAYDSTHNYFVRLYKVAFKGDPSPIELVKDDIERIILNKRKIELLSKVEDDIYNDALKRGLFTIYE
jgi:hypothetical protein